MRADQKAVHKDTRTLVDVQAGTSKVRWPENHLEFETSDINGIQWDINMYTYKIYIYIYIYAILMDHFLCFQSLDYFWGRAKLDVLGSQLTAAILRLLTNHMRSPATMWSLPETEWKDLTGIIWESKQSAARFGHLPYPS